VTEEWNVLCKGEKIHTDGARMEVESWKEMRNKTAKAGKSDKFAHTNRAGKHKTLKIYSYILAFLYY